MRECATTLKPEMSADEHALLTTVLQQPVRKGQHLEIGTAAGGTLCAMLQTFRATERPKFVVVDPMAYFPHQLDTVVRNLREHQLDPYSIDFRVADSRTAFEQAASRKESFDFILVDGCHKILSVIEDLKWLRLLNVGGVVCFHDFTPKHRGVWLAVNRLLSGWKNYEVIGQAGSLLAVRKNVASLRPEMSATDLWYARAWYVPLQIERKLQKLRRAA